MPGDRNVYYAGGASGGVWKSTDGGTRWRPIFDEQAAQSIGALAVAPSDPNIVWAGTGETFIRSNVSLGDPSIDEAAVRRVVTTRMTIPRVSSWRCGSGGPGS